MRISVLGSGSRGNAVLVDTGKGIVLVDVGFSYRETKRRLAMLGVKPTDVAAVCLTHEHTDHIVGLGAWLNKHPATPLYCTEPTADYVGPLLGKHTVLVTPGEVVPVAGVDAVPVAVPHDARSPVLWRFGDHAVVGLDCGAPTPEVVSAYRGAKIATLESNHDGMMLWQSEYPEHVKERIASPIGHLSNEDAALVLDQCSALKVVVAVHVSERANTFALVRDALNRPGLTLRISTQDAGTPWHSAG